MPSLKYDVGMATTCPNTICILSFLPANYHTNNFELQWHWSDTADSKRFKPLQSLNNLFFKFCLQQNRFLEEKNGNIDKKL